MVARIGPIATTHYPRALHAARDYQSGKAALSIAGTAADTSKAAPNAMAGCDPGSANTAHFWGARTGRIATTNETKSISPHISPEVGRIGSRNLVKHS